jgi:hypothetical protein
MRHLLPAAAREIDPRACDEHGYLQASGDPAVGDREGDRGQFGIDPLGDQDHELVGACCH